MSNSTGTPKEPAGNFLFRSGTTLVVSVIGGSMLFVLARVADGVESIKTDIEQLKINSATYQAGNTEWRKNIEEWKGRTDRRLDYVEEAKKKLQY